MDEDSHCPQVSEFSFDPRIAVLSRRAGQDPVEPGEPSEIAAKSRAIRDMSLPQRPPAKSVIDSIDAMDLARAPAQDVSKERVDGFGCVLGSQRSLGLDPVVVMQVLLFIVS